jgi:RsmE family RNA methyltransferase
LSVPPQMAVLLVVGPPGGFTDAERNGLRSGGFHRISLGPSRLTSETAAVALLASARNLLLYR